MCSRAPNAADMVQKKCSVKILEMFSKTLRTVTNHLPSVITVCNKEGGTPFHCLDEVSLDGWLSDTVE